MLRFLLFALLAWFLYNLIFRFIVPIYRTTRVMKKKFREMHEQADQQRAQAQPTAEPRTSKSPSGEYIDFEDVK